MIAALHLTDAGVALYIHTMEEQGVLAHDYIGSAIRVLILMVFVAHVRVVIYWSLCMS